MSDPLRRCVLITGAAGNLARAVAHEFAQQGCDLALLDLTETALGRTYPEPAENRLLLAADLMQQTQVDDAVARTVAKFGRIDVLCNLAGGFRMGHPLHGTPDKDWNFLFDLNTRSILHTARAVVPRMLQGGGGRIVNVAAFAAQRGAAQMAAYVAAKSAVMRLTESMALELREQLINVNCVMPTIIDTPENRAAMPDADPQRWVAPSDLAAVIAFLASDAARAVHGAALPVTGLS